MPDADPPLSAPERLARIIAGLGRAVAARGVRGGLTAALLVLLWNRLSRAARRVRRLGDRIAGGASLVPRHRPTPRPGGKPQPHLPRGHAWLVRLAPGTAACASQLQFLLAEPDMATLANAPQMRRLLRPLCRMLGVALPPLPDIPAAATEPPPPARPAPQIPRPARREPPRSATPRCPPRHHPAAA